MPTADVGYPVAQLGGQLSGGEIAPPTGAGRPVAVSREWQLLRRPPRHSVILAIPNRPLRYTSFLLGRRMRAMGHWFDVAPRATGLIFVLRLADPCPLPKHKQDGRLQPASL
jgi:hypothetical protein